MSTPRHSDDLESPDVSPIEAPSHTQQQFPNQQRKPRSQLPVPRKPTPDAAAASASNDKKTGTRWDDYSGEPTTSDKGKPAAVMPGTQPLDLQYPALKEKTRQILAGLRERDAAKKEAGTVVPLVQNDPLDNPVEREPWKGASGRTALVNPVRNDPKPRPEPIQIPANSSSKRVDIVESKVGNAAKPISSTVILVPSEDVDEGVKPPAPLRLGKNSPIIKSPVTAEAPKSLQSPFRSPHYLEALQASIMVPSSNAKRSLSPINAPLTPVTPTPSQPYAVPSRSDSREELTPTNSRFHPSVSQHQPRSDSLQPVQTVDAGNDHSSRFSWTTYATTVSDSPPDTPRMDADAPPVPGLPSMPPALAMRKRPVQERSQTVPQTMSSPTVPKTRMVNRKPTPADRRRTTSTLLTTASDLSKSLPQCPPELEAVDKISILEARMEEFARRKRNVNKLIKQLTTGGQPTAIAFNPRNQEERKRMLIGLESELADIVQEEHEVGLRLHRVQRKKDRDENYDTPTGLWIKRVTNYQVDMLT